MKDNLISHYRILGELGAGGMGVVYRAEDTKLGRTVALKFIAPQGIESAEERARFIHEARAAASLSHPNICTIHEIDEADGRLFLAMEYVEGESLKDRIAHGPLKIDETIDIAVQIAQGLDAAHREGVVHRDVKPANVMIEAGGLVKIMDFGLAKMSGRSKLTKTGTTLGTPAYMSPEQASGAEADHSSDIWSLGAVIYEMVAGRTPFKGDYEQAVLYSILNEAPEPLTAVRAGVPMELDRIVAKGAREGSVGEISARRRAYRRLASPEEEPRNRGRIEGWNGGCDIDPGAGTRRKAPKRRLARTLIPICIAAAAVAAFFLLRPVLFGDAISTERHPVAVITFENQTGDPQYDNLKKVIPNLLITSLEQSKYLRSSPGSGCATSSSRRGSRASRISTRTSASSSAAPKRSRPSSSGALPSSGIDSSPTSRCSTSHRKGASPSRRADGRGLESIPEQVDKLSRQISRGVGLSERKIEETQRPVIDVTTSSTEAYTYYLKGMDALERLYHGEAVQNFTKAIEIDSTFAAAYLFLGKAHAAAFNGAEALRSYTKALHHAAKATERERLYINAEYAASVQNNRDEGIRIYRGAPQEISARKYAWTFLGKLYRAVSMSREAIECDERAIELDPTFGEALNDLAYNHLYTANYEKALAVFKRYSALYPPTRESVRFDGGGVFRDGQARRSRPAVRKGVRVEADDKLGHDARLSARHARGLPRGDFVDRTGNAPGDATRTARGRLYLESVFPCVSRGIQPGRAGYSDGRSTVADSTGNSGMMGVARQIEGICFTNGDASTKHASSSGTPVYRPGSRLPDASLCGSPSRSATWDFSMQRLATYSRHVELRRGSKRSCPPCALILRPTACARPTGLPFSMRSFSSRRDDRTTPSDA